MDFGATRPISHFQYVHAENVTSNHSGPSDTHQTDSSNGVHQTNTVFALNVPLLDHCAGHSPVGPILRLPSWFPALVLVYIRVFLKWGYPQIIQVIGRFQYWKPWFWGTPHFRNPPMCIVNGIYEPTNKTEGGHRLEQFVTNVISIFPCNWHLFLSQDLNFTHVTQHLHSTKLFVAQHFPFSMSWWINIWKLTFEASNVDP